MRQRLLIATGLMLLGALAFGAVKSYVDSSKKVATAQDILGLFYETRGSLPPLPSPVSYDEVLKQLSEGRADFVAKPNWAYVHRAGTYYLSDKSKLKKELTLPVQLVAYEDLLRETVVLSAISEETKNVVTLAMVDASEFAEYDGSTSLESYLLKELGPRRMIWSATLKSETDLWADLLRREKSVTVTLSTLTKTMSASEPMSEFCVVQEGSNLSVNLPPGFAGAEITLESCGSLVGANWTNVWQTNVVGSGLVGIGSPAFPAGRVAPTAFFRVSASSSVDSDGDGLDDVSEYEAGTDYLDADTDDDGVQDVPDVFPLDVDEWADMDGDGIGDNADLDDDGDGLLDEDEFAYFGGLSEQYDGDYDHDGLSNGGELYGLASYVMTTSSGGWVCHSDLSQSVDWDDAAILPDSWGISGLSADDEGAFAVDIGFDFPFFDTSFNRLHIGSNGTISFGDDPFGSYEAIGRLPVSFSNTVSFLAPLWSDFVLSEGEVRYRLDQDGPIPVFTVSWSNAVLFSRTNATFDFQCDLYESGTVVFRYGSASNSVMDMVSIGCQHDCLNSSFLFANSFSADVLTGSSIKFNPVVQAGFSYPDQMDSDQDGMGDALERMLEFLNPMDASDAQDDYDVDLYSNLEEAVYGSNLADPNDPLLIDADMDGNPNVSDVDDDNDAFSDAWERVARTDTLRGFGVREPLSGIFVMSPAERDMAEMAYPTMQTVAGTATNMSQVQVAVFSECLFPRHAYGEYKKIPTCEPIPVLTTWTLPVNEHVFEDDLPLFPGWNQVSLCGGGSLTECAVFVEHQNAQSLVFTSDSDVCITVKIGFPCGYMHGVLAPLYTISGCGSVEIPTDQLISSIYSVELYPNSYSGSSSSTRMVSLSIELDGQIIFSDSNEVTSSPILELPGGWGYPTWSLGGFAIHAQEYVVAAYELEGNNLTVVPQAFRVGSHRDSCLSVNCIQGPNDQNPVYLNVQQPAQFRLLGESRYGIDEIVPGQYLTYGLDVVRTNSVSASNAHITSTGVFIAQEPGHYQVVLHEAYAGVSGADSIQPVDVYVGGACISADYDRNGIIDDSDILTASIGTPFRFWINDDDDDPDSEVKGNDFPSAISPDYYWDLGNGTGGAVDGMRDLVDFFSVCIELDPLLCDTSAFSYYLSNEDSGLNFVYTELDVTSAANHLKNTEIAQELSSAATYRTWRTGIELKDVNFLERIESDHQAVLIVEGRNISTESGQYIGTKQPLVLTVEEKSSGKVVTSTELQLSLDSVKRMYRFKNLRADGTGRADALTSPENRPDEIASDKDFVFIHGYNVSASDGEATHAEVFKRMYQSGFTGRFWGVSWYGDPPALANAHYHNAVVEAFAVASEFRMFLMGFESPPDLAAHSLGNGVVGIALNDAAVSGNLIRNYFALDAAMALEAYGDIANNTNMVCGEPFNLMEVELVPSDTFECSWREYPDDVWASEWYRLFDASDFRSTLTWRNRMEHAVDHVASAYNFYSSTEEVLRVDENCRSYWSTLQNWSFSWPPVDGGYYAWQIQEWYKGTASAVPSSLAGGSSKQAGWGVVEDNSSVHMLRISSDYLLESPICVSNQLATNTVAYKDNLKSDPFFKHEPEILFATNGSSFVSDFVMNQSAYLDYTPDSVGYVQVRDWLLAKGFPARTRPMGSSPIALGTGWEESYDMSTILKTHGWPRATKYLDDPEWRHGDFKDVAYPYVQDLYKKWVELGE